MSVKPTIENECDNNCVLNSSTKSIASGAVQAVSIASKANAVVDPSIMKLVCKVAVTKLDCSFGVVKEEEDAKSLQSAVMDQLRCRTADVVIVFAVRRPSCSSCREHAMQLVELATKLDRRVSVMAVVKETGVADEELIKFYQDYFRMPIYKDEKWALFHAMGGRRLGVLSTISGLFKSFKRHYDKKIENAWMSGGESFLQGGLLLFDKKANVRFSYEEVFGEELDMDVILGAVKQTRAIYRAMKADLTSIEVSSSHDEDPVIVQSVG